MMVDPKSNSDITIEIKGDLNNSTIRVGEPNACNSHKSLPPEERLKLKQTLDALLIKDLSDLAYGLGAPHKILPNSESHDNQCLALLEWAEGEKGPGLQKVEELLSSLISERTKKAPKFLSFAISGKVNNATAPEVRAIVQLLRQKTGDDSIDVAFYEEGSIRVVLNGSSEGLAKLQDLYDSGELDDLELNFVEKVQSVDNGTPASRKAKLLEALRYRSHVRLLTHTFDLARNLARDLDLNSDYYLDFISSSTRALASYRNIDRDRDRDLSRKRDLSYRALASYRDVAVDIARDIDRCRDLIRYRKLHPALELVRDLARNIASTFDLVLDLSTNVLGFTSQLSSASALTNALASALTNALELTNALDIFNDLDVFNKRTRDFDRKFDLTSADLSKANLRNVDLRDVDLTDADLTGADVEGTIFGDNKGLSESAKLDLQRRGAIFQDSPGSDVPSLVRV